MSRPPEPVDVSAPRTACAHVPGVCEDYLGRRYMGCVVCGERAEEGGSDDTEPDML